MLLTLVILPMLRDKPEDEALLAFIEADAATNVASPSGLALPSPSRTRRDADP